MMDEGALRHLLAEAAGAYQPPPGGPRAVLGAAEVAAPSPVRRTGPPRLLALAACVLAVVGAIAFVAARTDDSSIDVAGEATDERLRAPSPSTTVPSGDVDAVGGAGSGGALAEDGGGAGSGGEDAVAGGPAPIQTAAPRVVKTGSLALEVRRGTFARTVDRISSLAVGLGGFIAETKTFDTGDAEAPPGGSVTVRVPAGDFERVLSQVRRLGKVSAVTTSGRDVTAEYTDLEARLRALDATRSQLLTLLDRAGTIPDVLAVQDRVTAVQVEIERLQGQKNVLDDRTTFATLKVSVNEPGEAGTETEEERSGLGEAWDDARHGFTSSLEWIIARSGTTLVVVGAMLSLLFGARAAWPALRRRLV